jgi:hypothetical protein
MHRVFCSSRKSRQERNAYLAALSRYLHEPQGAISSLLKTNRKYLREVDCFRNTRQRKYKLTHHLRSFQFSQDAGFHCIQNRFPGSRILVSFHFGDFIYGNNVLASSEEPERQQYFLTQLPSTTAFIKNMNDCFGADRFARRTQITTDSTQAAALVARLRGETCTLLTFADLPPGFGEATRLRFLGRDAWFPKGPSLLALMAKAPLIPVLNWRHGRTNRVKIYPLITPDLCDGESLQQASSRITQKLVTILEDALLQNPWQWRFLSALPSYFQPASSVNKTLDGADNTDREKFNDTGSQRHSTQTPESVPARRQAA